MKNKLVSLVTTGLVLINFSCTAFFPLGKGYQKPEEEDKKEINYKIPIKKGEVEYGV